MALFRRIVKWSGIGLPVALVIAQFVPVDRTNPPVESEVPAPPDVRAVLRRACYDCHSNETVWPWYSRVAPVSWLIARDVHQGRRHVNFSTWNSRSPQAQQKALREAAEQVEGGEMPLWFYLPLHPSARLSDADKTLILSWTRTAPGETSSHQR